MRLLALLALGLAAPAASALDVSVDPRFELLGVVQQLAGAARAGEETAAYRKQIDRRFAAFKSHPVVALYRDLAASPSREEACATILIYFSAPPELKLLDKNARIHYVSGDGEREEMQRFLWELRAFARASNFGAFFKENAAFYRRAEEDARSRIGPRDPIAAIEALLGMSLASRSHYILPLLARKTHNFIVPYPLPPASLGATSFDVYTLSAQSPKAFSHAWQEPLYVFIDPSFHYFQKLNVPDPAAFYGPEIARCAAVSPDCTKEYVVMALIERLNRGAAPVRAPAGRFVASEFPSERDRRYMSALSERLDEYERDRVRYPTLWDFYPRLFSVFHELAHGGKPASLSVPAGLPLRSAADFFAPMIVRRLNHEI